MGPLAHSKEKEIRNQFELMSYNWKSRYTYIYSAPPFWFNFFSLSLSTFSFLIPLLETMFEDVLENTWEICETNYTYISSSLLPLISSRRCEVVKFGVCDPLYA
jgi:hypothetical protein